MKTRSSAQGVKTIAKAAVTKSQSVPRCAPRLISKSTDRYAHQTPRAGLPAKLLRRFNLGRPQVDGRKSPVLLRSKPEKQQSDQRYYKILLKKREAVKALLRRARKLQMKKLAGPNISKAATEQGLLEKNLPAENGKAS